MSDEARYSNTEMMAISAGRLVKDGDVLFAGTGVSILAATVAKRIHAPDSVVFFETGGIDPSLDELPMAVADPRVMSGTALNAGLIEAFSILGHRRLRTMIGVKSDFVRGVKSGFAPSFRYRRRSSEFRGHHTYFGGALVGPTGPGFRRRIDLLKGDSSLAMKSSSPDGLAVRPWS